MDLSRTSRRQKGAHCFAKVVCVFLLIFLTASVTGAGFWIRDRFFSSSGNQAGAAEIEDKVTRLRPETDAVMRVVPISG